MSVNDGACTISTVIADERVSLRHVVGPLEPERTVSGACCIVRALDVPEIEPHELIYLGVADVVTEIGADAFVLRCLEEGAAALAWPEWLERPVVDELVEALGRLAAVSPEAIGGFEMPEGVRFTTVSRVVAESNAMPESARFQRLLYTQQQLVEALAAEPPVQSMVDTLARLTGGIAGVTAEDGSIEASSGALPFMLFRQEALPGSSGEAVFHVAGWHVVGTVLRVLPGEPSRWLFVARRSAGFASMYVRAAARVAGSLIDATRRVNEIVTKQDRATRAFVLREALEAAPHEHSELLGTRAGALGIDFREEVRILELRHAKTRSEGSDIRLAEEVNEAFQGAATLVLEHGEGATVLAQCSPAQLEPALQQLLKAESSLIVGVGRPMRRINEARASGHDAMLAAQTARRAKRGRVVRYDEFDLGTRLLADVDRTDMDYWVAQLLEPLSEKTMLLDTLIAFFDEQLDIMRTAKRLDIHHNTLRYRLAKIEEALDGSLQSPAMIASLHLALSTRQSPGAPRRSSNPNGPATADAEAVDIVGGGPSVSPLGDAEAPIVE